MLGGIILSIHFQYSLNFDRGKSQREISLPSESNLIKERSGFAICVTASGV
jgi:hypothetical protein